MARRGGWLLLGAGLPLGFVYGVYGNAFDAAAPLELHREKAAVAPRSDRAYRVAVISIDGLSPRLLSPSRTPVLVQLMRDGTTARLAETIVPSSTLPSHTSMISGVPLAVHRVEWNNYRPWRRVDVPTLFSVCRREGLRCGLVAGKRKFAHLAEPEPGVERYLWRGAAGDVLAAALDYARERDPDFLMVHVAEVDHAGHGHGWGSREQLDALAHVDFLLGRFLDALAETGSGRRAVLVPADHGGHGKEHGTAAPEDVRIPWVLWGEGIPARELKETVSTVDTAPTVLALLGIDPPESWQGRARFQPAGEER